MKKILYLFVFLGLFTTLSAQEKKGNELYDNLGYLSAAEEYQNLTDEELTYEIKEKLATSFRLNSQYETAEYWYAQIIQESNDPEITLYYAQMLQSNGKCEDAIRWYQSYQEKNASSQRTFIEDCKDLDKFDNHKNIKVENVAALNSDQHDFSPIPYKNGLVFTSMRGGEYGLIDQWTNSSFSDLYFVKKNGDQYETPTILEGDVNGQYHDGVASFDPIRQEMIFTRNMSKEESEAGIKNLEIYTAKNKNDKWTEPTKLSFTDKEYSSCHPTLSADGQRLYFASEQPGGFGGMDIYVAHRSGNNWGTPSNLGPIVNTAGNEIFPFISQKDKLFFASDGHTGIGGLDIFVVEKSTDKDELSWADRKNIGKPFNTEKDDFGFYIDANEETGYLSSNRIGGMGEDDIYAWKTGDDQTKQRAFDPNPNNANPLIAANIQTLNICDADSKEKIADAKVAILKVPDNWIAFQEDNKLPNNLLQTALNGSYSVQVAGGYLRADASLTSDDSGLFEYFYQPQQSYAIFAEKNYYAPTYQQMSGLEIAQRAGECIYLEKRNCVTLKGQVKNKNFDTFIAGATISIIDQCSGEMYTTTTDRKGQFEQCLDCKCAFTITVNKVNFKESILDVSTENTPCIANVSLRETIELELDILNPTDQNLSPDYVNQFFTGDPRGNYTVGQILTLKNIYYDFDKYNIRADAAYELDYLVALLNQNPTMEVDLSAHTDSRGKEKYNQWLSEERAKSARKYLINQGIASARIHNYAGYGETQLVNNCSDGVSCSEEAHQLNRRTEVRIVGYKDNLSSSVETGNE